MAGRKIELFCSTLEQLNNYFANPSLEKLVKKIMLTVIKTV